MKEKPTSLQHLVADEAAKLENLRFPVVQRPRGECPATPYPFALFVYVAVEEANFVCESKSLKPVRLPNLIKTAEIVEDIEEDAGLYSREPRFGGL